MSVLKDGWIFLREFLLHPRQLGSAVPSSGFLRRRILRAAQIDDAQLVVELGPGSGGTTRAILQALPPQARLLSIELNEGLFQLTSQIEDARYVSHCGNALDLQEILDTHQLGRPDAVISGIPFSCMDSADGAQLIERIHQLLVPGGRFVAYQVSARVDQLNTCFDAPGNRSVSWELFCIPPLRVWRWQKA